MDSYTLHYKVLEGDIDEVRAAISQSENLNELDELGYSALHWAVINKQADIVKLLLEAGANANVVSGNGLTPKENAIDFDFVEIEQLLTTYEAMLFPNSAFNNTGFLRN